MWRIVATIHFALSKVGSATPSSNMVLQKENQYMMNFIVINVFSIYHPLLYVTDIFITGWLL